jgi:hypothetical protein
MKRIPIASPNYIRFLFIWILKFKCAPNKYKITYKCVPYELFN